jgi:hypothetical protein
MITSASVITNLSALPFGFILNTGDKRLKKNQPDAHLFLVYFVNFYIFRAYLGQSLGDTTLCIQQLVLINLFR